MEKLKDYICQIRGVSYKPQDCSNKPKDNYIPLLRANNISNGKINFENLVYVNETKVKKEQLLKKGDVLICTSSGSPELVGKAGIINEDINVTFGAFCKVLRLNKKCNYKYFNHYFQSDFYKREIQKCSNGANIKNLKTENFDNLDVNIIDLDLQENISVRLDLVKEIIDIRQKQITDLNELVKSQFVELFGNKEERKYEVIKLSEISKFQQGTQVPIEEQFEECKSGYVRFLRIIDYTQAPQIPRYVENKGRLIDENSVVIVRYGASAGFVGKGYNGILANNLFEVIPNTEVISKEFLYNNLKYGSFENEINQKSFGAAMPALSFNMVGDISIIVPPKELQNKYSDFVKLIDKQKFEIEKSLKEMEELYDSLMEEYFG